MRANLAKNLPLSLLASFVVMPAFATDAAPGTPPSAPGEATVAAARAVAEAQAAAAFASMPVHPAWPQGMFPMMWPMPYALPLHPAMAGGMLVPVPIYGVPGMPVPPTWIPVFTMPVPPAAPVALPAEAGVDYGPVSDTPVVELPPSEDASAPPAVEPGAALVPAAGPVDPPWTAPAVDYGPVTATPVVDLLTLEAPPAAPPPVSKSTRSGAKAKTPAKGAAAPRKNRMCWENGVVAPCK
jgi:hypothetical protein